MLLIEEQEELVRSNKKPKDAKHVGYRERQDIDSVSPNHDQGGWSDKGSFRDKLVGDSLGAYNQAFCFGDDMEDDEGSNEEVENLCEGLVAVKFSRDFKQQIHKPWMRALIVKVYGRNVGLTFSKIGYSLCGNLLVGWTVSIWSMVSS